jgi:WD40 repeat protein
LERVFPQATPYHAVYNRAGTHLAISSYFPEQPSQIWTIDDEPIAKLEMTAQVLAWSPDGRLIAGNGWGDVALCSSDSGKRVGTLLFSQASELRPFPLGWSADSKRLALAPRDNTVRVWNVANQERTWTAIALPNDETAVITAAGQFSSAAASIDSSFVCLVESQDGEFETLSPPQFRGRIGQPPAER